MTRDCIRLAFAGDFLPPDTPPGSSAVDRSISRFLRDHDESIVNLEAPLVGPRPRPSTDHYSKAVDLPHGERIFLHAQDSACGLLSRQGFTVVGLANNHMLDHGEEALLRTLDMLHANGLRTVGAGACLSDAEAPLLLESRGICVALIAASYTAEAGHRRPGCSPLRAKRLAQRIQEARTTAGADTVVLYLHAGAEFAPEPRPATRALYRWLVDAGADVVVGHHPHVAQPVEPYGRGIIAYSLGNFQFPVGRYDALGRAAPREWTQTGMVLSVELSAEGVVGWGTRFVADDGNCLRFVRPPELPWQPPTHPTSSPSECPPHRRAIGLARLGLATLHPRRWHNIPLLAHRAAEAARQRRILRTVGGDSA